MIRPLGTLVAVVEPPKPPEEKKIILPEGVRGVIEVGVVVAVGPAVGDIDPEVTPGTLVYYKAGCGLEHDDQTIVDVHTLVGWEDDVKFEVNFLD